MKRLLYITSLIIIPFLTFCQERLVINGAAPVTIVENGGTFAKPIYIEIANPAINAIQTHGKKGWIISENEFNKVKWDIGITTGADTVPFGYSSGAASYFLPLAITIGAAGSAGGSILFSTWHTQGDNWTGTTSLTGHPIDVTGMDAKHGGGSPSNTDNSYNVVDRFWTIDPHYGGYKYAPTIPVLSNIMFSFIDNAAPDSGEFLGDIHHKNTSADESLLLAQQFDTVVGSIGWNFEGTANTYAASAYSASVATVNSGAIPIGDFFRSWTLSTSDNPLPIQLLYFACSPIPNGFQLRWETASEQNNKYFTIERSSDGINFSTIATNIPGAGNSVTTKSYSYDDMNPSKGFNYYRLSQTDDFGNTVQDNVSECEAQDSVIVYPNPASGRFSIQLPLQDISNPTVISVYDLLGRQIYNRTVQNQQTVDINISDLASSLYLVSIVTSEKTYTAKLFVKK